MAFISINPELPDPMHIQLVNQIEAAIEHGDLGGDALLPTVRQLARDLGIAPNTVVRAYATLQHSGWIIGDGRRGTRVSNPHPQPSANARSKTLQAAIDALIETFIYRGYSRENIGDALEAGARRSR
jgi:GntR family transcriptional regulator